MRTRWEICSQEFVQEMSARKDMIWYSAGVILGQLGCILLHKNKWNITDKVRSDREFKERRKRVKGFSSRGSHSPDSNLNSSVQSFRWHYWSQPRFSSDFGVPWNSGQWCCTCKRIIYKNSKKYKKREPDNAVLLISLEQVLVNIWDWTWPSRTFRFVPRQSWESKTALILRI